MESIGTLTQREYYVIALKLHCLLVLTRDKMFHPPINGFDRCSKETSFEILANVLDVP